MYLFFYLGFFVLLYGNKLYYCLVGWLFCSVLILQISIHLSAAVLTLVLPSWENVTLQRQAGVRTSYKT